MTLEQNKQAPADLGVFPDVDLVLVEDHTHSIEKDQERVTVNRFFRIHMDVLIDDDDVWKYVSDALKHGDHAKIYRKLLPTPGTKRGHKTLKAALGQ